MHKIPKIPLTENIKSRSAGDMLKERHAAKWDHQTWDEVITDRDLILKHLEKSCTCKYPQPFLHTSNSDVVVGPGPTPEGLRYSPDTLLRLRDEGLVTSWKDNKIYIASNSPSTTVEWWFGEEEFEGPGILNGEEI